MKLAPGLLLVSRYRIKHIVAEGGMSTIYKAVDTKTGNFVAVKELDEIDEDRDLARENEQIFINEARILSKLTHRSIPRILDFFVDNKKRYLIMEFVDGSDLHTIQKKLGNFDEKTVLGWTCQLIEVLEYLHSRTPPVIFRDIKPSNIMLEPMGRIRLVDFGIARTYKPDSYRDTVNLGSGGYAAPEQYERAGRQTDMRSDIYSLGVTVHQLLTGIDPVDIGFRIPPPTSVRPELSSTWDEIILKAVQLEPEDRYKAMSEMKDELTTLMNTVKSPDRQAAEADPCLQTEPSWTCRNSADEEASPDGKSTRRPGSSFRRYAMTLVLVVFIIAGLYASLCLLGSGGQFPAWMKAAMLAGGALWFFFCGAAIYFITKRST